MKKENLKVFIPLLLVILALLVVIVYQYERTSQLAKALIQNNNSALRQGQERQNIQNAENNRTIISGFNAERES